MKILRRIALAFGLLASLSAQAQTPSASPLAQYQSAVSAVPWLNTTGQVSGIITQGLYNKIVPIFSSMGSWDPVTGLFTPNTPANLPLSALAPIASNVVVGNRTGASAAPSTIALPSCSSTGNALTYTLSAGFGCATFPTSAGAIVNAGTAGQLAYYAAPGTTLSGETVSGDITIAAGGVATLKNLGSAAGPVGSATVTPIITTDANGRVSVISSATIAPPFSALTGSLLAAQVPAFAGPCSIAAGGTTISCATLLVQANTWALAQTFTTSPVMPTLTSTDNSTKGATTAYVTTGINNLAAITAPLASPALTGVPTAPTGATANTTQIATQAYVQANSVSTASPAFTGTPTAPTATAGTNTTQIATTAFSTGGIATAVAPLAPLASPALTGAPTAPTAAVGTSTTQVATTAFVQAAGVRQLLATLTCNSTTTCNTALQDTTHITSTFSEYDVVIEQCFANTASTNLVLRPQVAGAFPATGYTSQITDLGAGSISGTTQTTGILVLFQMANTSTIPSTSQLHFSLSSGYTGITHVFGTAAVSPPDSESFNGYYGTAGAWTGIQIIPQTVNTITSCTMKVYGSN